jgi:hypothetical protein
LLKKVKNILEQEMETFVTQLTRAPTAEIQEYLLEIRSDREFHEQLERNWRMFSRRSSFWWAPGVSATLGMSLYVLCRKLQPSNVVETGVSSGVSSAYILRALAKSQHGGLHSIDLPQEEYSASNDDDSGPKTGWLIPDYLRDRWHLTPGTSSDKLVPVLEKLQTIDIFMHDSEHTYRNMMWEYQTAWHYLKVWGVLVSHNIDTNNAFPNFCRSVNGRGYLLEGMGGIAKT